MTPRPVIREFAQQPWVQFQTDRTVGQPLGPLVWREAPVRVLHGKAETSTVLEPCARPLVAGERGEARGLGYRLEPGAVFDRLYLDKDKMVEQLSPGAFHGGCVVDEKRLWIAWSTPTRPAELFTIVLKDGSVRPLRDEARPGLGGLADLVATDEGGVLVARRKDASTTKARGVVVVLAAGEKPAALGAFSPTVRAFVEDGFVVLRRAQTPEAAAKATALADGLVAGGAVDPGPRWLVTFAAAPANAPPNTLWIDPADVERTLARALTVLTPEAPPPPSATSSTAATSASAPGGSTSGAPPAQVDK